MQLDEMLEINNEGYSKLPDNALIAVYEDYDNRIIKCYKLGLVEAGESLSRAMRSLRETLFERGIIQ